MDWKHSQWHSQPGREGSCDDSIRSAMHAESHRGVQGENDSIFSTPFDDLSAHSGLTSAGGFSTMSISQMASIELPPMPEIVHLIRSRHGTSKGREQPLPQPDSVSARGALSLTSAGVPSGRRTGKLLMSVDPSEVAAGPFSGDAVIKTFRFILSSASSQMSEITFFDLEEAFRALKQAQRETQYEAKAKRFMQSFKFFLKVSRKTREQWFEEISSNQECKVSWNEFENGVKRLVKSLGNPPYSKTGLLAMLRYMDPHCHGDLTADHLHSVYKRMKKTSKFAEVISGCGEVFEFLQRFLMEKGIRVQDMFKYMCVDKNEGLSLRGFAKGLEKLHRIYEFQSAPAGSGKTARNHGSIKLKPLPSDSVSVHDASRVHIAVKSEEPGRRGRFREQKASSNNLDSDNFGLNAKSRNQGGQAQLQALSAVSTRVGAHGGSLRRIAAYSSLPHFESRHLRSDVDQHLLQERQRYLRGVSLSLPPPRRVDNQRAVSMVVREHKLWLEKFDMRLRENVEKLLERR